MPNIGNSSFSNDTNTGTVGADGYLGTPTDALVATPSGNQSTALLLPTFINGIGTVGTAADSVRLPLAVAGQVILVANTTVTSAQAFGSGTDTINGITSATGVALAGGKNALFFALTSAPAGKWRMILSA